MLNSPIWKITGLSTKGEFDAVVVCFWNCSVRDDADPKIFASVSSRSEFTANPQDPNFIPFDQLSEQNVLDWLWADGFKAEIESRVLNKVSIKKEKPVERPLPW